ncbi:MAG: hypothetical protein HXY20_05745 [Acidobacteria bacterium]|nr:hypothetical protein [Acidobacteriota bacterium]
MPIPIPAVHDEYNHLLVADTLSHGRLANPTHQFWRHFEAPYVVHRPTYSSTYPLGQGLMLALGKLLGHPWYGVLLSMAVLLGINTWALRQWVAPQWALFAGLVAAFRLGISSYWIDSYWGGAVSGIGGAMIFGSIPRLLGKPERHHVALATAGWSVVWLSRPYESLFIGLILGLLVAFASVQSSRTRGIRSLIHVLAPGVLILSCCFALTAWHNWSVSGNPFALPYQFSQKIYGVPQNPFWLPPVPEPRLDLEDLRRLYSWQLGNYEQGKEIQGAAMRILWNLNRLLSFYLGYPFYVLAVSLPAVLKKPAVAATLAVGLLGYLWSMLYAFFFPHYMGAYLAPLLLVTVESTRVIRRLSLKGIPLGLWLTAGLLFSAAYAGIAGSRDLQCVGREAREWSMSKVKAIEKLQSLGGQHLVFVRYGLEHNFHYEWVYNDAEIDQATVVWAREIDPHSDAALIDYFAGRRVWVVRADEDPEPIPYPSGATRIE